MLKALTDKRDTSVEQLMQWMSKPFFYTIAVEASHCQSAGIDMLDVDWTRQPTLLRLASKPYVRFVPNLRGSMTSKCVRSAPLVLLAALAWFFPLDLSAQVPGGLITVRVIGPCNAVSPWAHVASQNPVANLKREVAANGSGACMPADLLTGIDKESVKSPGFTTEIQRNADLQVRAALVLRVTTAVGTYAERIAASTMAATVQICALELSGAIGSEESTHLQLNAKVWSWSATFQPGISAMRDEQATDNRIQQGSGQQVNISDHYTSPV